MGFLVDAVLLYVLTTTFGDYKDTSTRWKVLAIVIAAAIVLGFVAVKHPSDAGLMLEIVLSAITVTLLLVFWCRMSWTSALKITGIYMGIRLALSLVIEALTAQASG